MSKKKDRKPRVVNAVFNYTSKCCEAPAKKPPVIRTPEDRRENKFSESNLGHWRCTKCGKATKVTRAKVNNAESRETKDSNTE